MMKQSFLYRISSYSFRGNYSFLNLEIQRSQCIMPKVTVHKGGETIQGRKLFKGGNYMRKYVIYLVFYQNQVEGSNEMLVPKYHHLLCPITWHPLQFISSHLVQHFLKKPQPWRSQRYFLQCFTYSCHCFHSCLSPPFVHQLALSSTCFALTLLFSAIFKVLFRRNHKKPQL